MVALAMVATLGLVWGWLPERLVFPAHLVGTGARAEVPGTQRFRVDVPGARLEGLQWRGKGRLPDKPLVLAFGGNAMDAADFGGWLAQVLPRHEVVAVNYRGYGASTGRARTGVLEADALAVRDALPKGRPVVVVGASIGSAAAAHVVAQRGDGAVLITPFDRLGAVFDARVPGSGFWLDRDLSPGADLAKGRGPVFVITAQHDEIFGPRQAAALEARAQGVVEAVVLPGTGHSSIYAHPGINDLLARAVEAVSSS